MNFIALFFLNPIEGLITLEDILIILSLVFLVSYLKFIEFPKETVTQRSNHNNLDRPIYKFKDILLQEKNIEINEVPTSNHHSFFIKVTALLVMLFIIAIPLYQILKINPFT